MRRLSSAWSLLGLAAALAMAIGVPAVALAMRSTTPKLVGSPKAGKPVFQNTCGVCHKLKAAGTTATIGPDLNRVILNEAVIIRAITNGGATVMTKAQAAKYAGTTQMIPYRNVLKPLQIQDIAAFVYISTHPK